MSVPVISVVLPLYNDAETIGGVLDGLAHQAEGTPPFEIVVIDDGSKDNGPQIARDRGARVITQANAGPARARNRGAEEAQSDVVLFLDSDCVPPSDWVARMSAPLIGETGFDAVVGTIRPANDGIVPRLVQCEVEDRYRGMQACSGQAVDFIAAPSCGMRRAVFLAIGGFDVTLRQAEDVEIAYRLEANGHRIAFVCDVPVAHAHQTGFMEFMRVKYRRAVGRFTVFHMHPCKRSADNWTPMAFKVQFLLIALGVVLIPVGLVWYGGTCVGATLILGAPLLTLPLVRSIATGLHGLTSKPAAIGVAWSFVIGRGLAIFAALLVYKLSCLRRAARTEAVP
ncbi:MAG: glycosyltransferase family 2 protein [Paracoccaceae bacterium]